MNYMPNLLLKMLSNTEKYCKGWLYQAKSESEKIAHWMGRAQKNQLPCSPGITVDTLPEGPKGYHFMQTFSINKWSPLMMSVEVIPNTKTDERE